MSAGKKFETLMAWALSRQAVHFSEGVQAEAIRSLWALLDGRLEPGSTALEVGSGKTPNPMTEMLAEHGVECLSLDPQPGAMLRGDAHDIPFPDATFDVVLSRHSLEHLLCPYLALREMMRVSRRWLVVSVPGDSPHCEDSPGHLWLLSERGYRLLFRHLGLQPIRFVERDITEHPARPQVEWQWLLEVG